MKSKLVLQEEKSFNAIDLTNHTRIISDVCFIMSLAYLYFAL